jgi:hypothetical protein
LLGPIAHGHRDDSGLEAARERNGSKATLAEAQAMPRIDIDVLRTLVAGCSTRLREILFESLPPQLALERQYTPSKPRLAQISGQSELWAIRTARL